MTLGKRRRQQHETFWVAAENLVEDREKYSTTGSIGCSTRLNSTRNLSGSRSAWHRESPQAINKRGNGLQSGADHAEAGQRWEADVLRSNG